MEPKKETQPNLPGMSKEAMDKTSGIQSRIAAKAAELMISDEEALKIIAREDAEDRDDPWTDLGNPRRGSGKSN